MLTKTQLTKLVIEKSDSYNIPYNISIPIVEVVSRWKAETSQFYSSYTRTNLKLKRPVAVDLDTEFIQQRTRWGLTGIFGYEARKAGFEGWLSSLVIAEVNLDWGFKHLSKILIRYKGNDVISAFNYGYPRRVNGQFINQVFVDRVLVAQKKYENT